jgi:hypothetical protein
MRCGLARCLPDHPGGQGRFSNRAIETALILDAALRLPLRQTEGFVRSLIQVMKLDLAVPDHTTLARRRRTVDVHDDRWPRKGPIDIDIDSTGLKFFGTGEWAAPGMAKRAVRGASFISRSIPTTTGSSLTN